MIKTQTDKIREITSIYTKLRQLGLNKTNTGIRKFQSIVQEYVLTEDSFSGKIYIHEAKRFLYYILPKTNKHNCEVSIRVK